MKFQKIVGTFYKSLFVLIIINLFGCATVKNEVVKTEVKKSNPKSVNNLSIYYFTMAETAIQDGDINLALQLYLKADKEAPENIYIKENILEILLLTSGQDKKKLDYLIELGSGYLQKDTVSESILNSLLNGYIQINNYEKFIEILNLQLKNYPSMNLYTMKYYTDIEISNKHNYKLLEKALECEWKDFNEVMAIAFEYMHDKDKVLNLVKKSYIKWTKEEVTYAELEEQYKTLGVNLLLTNLIQASLDSEHKLADKVKIFFLSVMIEKGGSEQIVRDLPYLINTNSTRVLEMLFVATLDQEDWETAIRIGKKIVSRKDQVSSKFVVMNLAYAFGNLGEHEEMLNTISMLENILDKSTMFLETYKLANAEGKDYLRASFAELSEDSNQIKYLEAIIDALEENYNDSMKNLQEIPNNYLLENNLIIPATTIYLDGKDIDKARELLKASADTTFTINEFIGVYFHRIGEGELALKYLQQELTENPNVSQNIFLVCSNIFNDLDDNKSSLEYLDKGLKRYPESSVMLNSVGYTIADYQVSQRYDEAEKYIKEALELDPENHMIWDSLAWLYFRQGEYQKALDILNEHCLESLKDSAISYHFAEIHLKLGNMDEAEKYLIYAFAFNNDESAKIASEKLWEEYFSTDSIEKNMILEKE